MEQGPVIKTYYSLDEDKIEEDLLAGKEKPKRESVQEGKLDIDDEKAFIVGLVTIICVIVLGICILSWWLISRNQNKGEVLGESIPNVNRQSEILENPPSPTTQPLDELKKQSTQKSASETYTVQVGDTLYSIGKKFKIDYQEIIDANGLEKTQVLKPGQKLIIPLVNQSNTEGQNEAQD